MFFMHQGISAVDRQLAVKIFQGEPLEPTETPSMIVPKEINILVGTYRILGTGYTCTAAYREFLFEMTKLKTHEEQAHGRIDRVNQSKPQTFSHRFISRKSPTDNTQLSRQEQRYRHSRQMTDVGQVEIVEINSDEEPEYDSEQYGDEDE